MRRHRAGRASRSTPSSESPTAASRAASRQRTIPTTMHLPAIVDLPDVAWISARDATRAPGDLEDQAARYHPGRHELTIYADFRAITDLVAHWRAATAASRAPTR